jgi:hypothetical protein
VAEEQDSANPMPLVSDLPSLTETDPNLVKKPGWIFYDRSDSELSENLCKFQGLGSNLFRSAARTISKESRGILCDCYLSKKEIATGKNGCNENCLNRLLKVEW